MRKSQSKIPGVNDRLHVLAAPGTKSKEMLETALMAKLALFLLLILNFPAYATPKLKVGVIAGFSGEWAAYGESYRTGIKLAKVEEQIQFIFEDDQFSPAKTVSAFRKLTTIDRVDALIVGDTTTAAALASLAEAEKILTLVWASSGSAFKDRKFIVRIWPPIEKEISAYVDAIHRLPYGKIMLLTSAHDYANDWGRKLKAALEPQEVYLQEFATDPTDYRALLLRAKTTDYSAFGLCLNPGQNGLFAEQMAQLGMKVPLFGSNFLEASADIQRAKSALNGAWFVSTAITPQFREKYLKATGHTDHIFSAAIHYDAAIALSLAITNGSGATLRDKLFSIREFSGAHKSAVFHSENGDQYIDFPLMRYEIENGAILSYETNAKAREATLQVQ